MPPAPSTVGALLAHLAQVMPQQEAVVFPPQRLTYAALYEQVAENRAGQGDCRPSARTRGVRPCVR
jgi:hypothetical protein